VRDLVALARYQIDENIELHISAPAQLTVTLPQSGIRQVLLNLLLNAADALDHHAGIIRIHIHSDANGLIITVSDTGTGFSQDMLDYGIRPFRTSRTRGTGLGLAMVQRFVKNLGGTLKLTNQQPHGARVSVCLPKAVL
jgi:signal transduction histidine kinase